MLDQLDPSTFMCACGVYVTCRVYCTLYLFCWLAGHDILTHSTKRRLTRLYICEIWSIHRKLMAGTNGAPARGALQYDGERRPHKTAARQRPPLRKRIVSVQAERGSYVGRGKNLPRTPPVRGNLGPRSSPAPARRCTTQQQPELPARLLLYRATPCGTCGPNTRGECCVGVSGSRASHRSL